MSELDVQFENIKPVPGVRLGCASAQIKYQGRDDLVLLEICEGATVSAVFTQNAFCAAPVTIAKTHLAKTTPRYLLINAGNANAGTGEKGIELAMKCCEAVAGFSNCNADNVLPFSTGVIGELLPADKIIASVPAIFESLSENNWYPAAKAIMTTDTVPKGVSITRNIVGHDITVTGMIKGSGMICPDMATLLAYIATDADVAQPILQQCLKQAVDRTFNRITIDGDTSTNDACVLVATGKTALAQIESTASEEYKALSETIFQVSEFLAKAVVRDGEGATKFVEISVENGKTSEECQQVAYTIAHSPLVKTALFASDPNWGRILAAIGRAGVENFDINKVNIYINDVCIVSNGGRDSAYNEIQGQQAMSSTDIIIRVELHRGDESARVWTCDFSCEYVKINAEYRT